MTLSMRFGIALLVALALAAPAAAQTKMSPAQSRAEFKAAQELYQADRCIDALPRFEKLARATESPNARLYVARCLRKLNRIPEAYEAFSAVIRQADTKSKEDERYADTRSAAAAERAAVESQVARIVIVIASPPKGLEVQVGERTIDRKDIGEPIALSPGKVEVRATAPGESEFKTSLELKGGALSTVTISFEAAGQAPGDTSPTSTGKSPAASSEVRSSKTPVLAYVALGIGAAGLATFGVAGYLADQRFNSLEDECAGGPCPRDKEQDIDGGRRLDTIANVGLIVGGIGVVSGAAILLFGRSSTAKEPKTEAFVAPAAGGARLGVTGRF